MTAPKFLVAFAAAALLSACAARPVHCLQDHLLRRRGDEHLRQLSTQLLRDALQGEELRHVLDHLMPNRRREDGCLLHHGDVDPLDMLTLLLQRALRGARA